MQKLIYYEHYRDVRDAIARESQLKVASEENQPDQSIEPTILVLLCYKTDKSTDLIRSLPVRSVSDLPVYVVTPQPLHSRLRFVPLEMTECAFGIENGCCLCQNRRTKQS
jgi:hypothetical protein